MKIAILSQGKFKPIGPFVRNYIANIPNDKIVIYGGDIPFLIGDKSEFQIKLIHRIIAVISLFNTQRSNKIKLALAKRVLRQNKIDCVIGEYFNISANYTEICKSLNIKLIPIGLGYELTMTKTVINNLEKYKKLINYASTSFVVSEGLLCKLKDNGVDVHSVIENPIGAEDLFFDIIPDYNSQTFLAIGRFVEKKAPHITIKCFSQVLNKFPNAKLIFAGDGPLLESSKKLVEDLQIEKNVFFIGWISREEQVDLLKKSSIFIQHSVTSKSGDSEGSPVAIIEASAAGLPIISTNHSGIPKLVQNNKTGILVDEFDELGMISAMEMLLSDNDKLRELGRNGKIYTRENFSNRIHISKMMEAINN
ncbi:glycosyltransferase family 4 protein [Empedobacter falsenii]